MKTWSCAERRLHSNFIARFPPLRRGVRGGGPGGTLAWYSVRVRLDPSGAPAEGQGPPLRSKVLVMPCSPPLTPPSQGGEKDRAIAANSDCANQKRASRNRPATTFNRVVSSAPTAPPFARGGNGNADTFREVRQYRWRLAGMLPVITLLALTVVLFGAVRQSVIVDRR